MTQQAFAAIALNREIENASLTQLIQHVSRHGDGETSDPVQDPFGLDEWKRTSIESGDLKVEISVWQGLAADDFIHTLKISHAGEQVFRANMTRDGTQQRVTKFDQEPEWQAKLANLIAS